MSRYDPVPISEEDSFDSQQPSSFIRRTDRNFSEHTNAFRTRAPSIVSDTPYSSLRKNNATTSITNTTSTDTSPNNTDASSTLSSGPSWSSSTSYSPLPSTSPLLLNDTSRPSENDSTTNSSNSKNQRLISNHSTHVRLFRMIWIAALLVGEYGIYWALINRCAWPENYSWDKSDDAVKERYRIAIIADPQLTDWMSYNQTGLLLKIVETYTDLFMKRSFHHFHSSLKPDAVVFLGDLNDGGRVSYGDVFEKNKERFFEKIFATKSTAWNQEPIVMDMANDNTAPSYSVEEVEHNESDQKDINITGHYNQLVDLPSDPDEREAIRNSGKSVRLYVAGNHDVGFGDTLIRPVMLRYKQLFGSVNYEIVVGNHSLVVLDTLSLSSNVTDIREESQQFLDNIANEAPSLPRILFTHVPLFRLDSTYCGDARESEKQILDIKGVQFQNMVNKPLSREILRGIQPDVIFSGDDHDWCEVAHSLDGRLTPEVTLRTFSFSQGTLQPSVLMLSLYNPELTTRNEYQMVPGSSGLPVSTGGENYESLARPSNNTTFVYEECMLPNQMLIYMCYASLLSITVSLILILRFRWIMQGRRHLAERSLLIRWKDPKYPTTSPQGSTTATAIPMHPYSDAAFSGESLLESSSSSSSNSFPGEMGQLKKTAVWPFLSSIYWRMVGWDVWNIARYAVPLYLIMFFLSSI